MCSMLPWEHSGASTADPIPNSPIALRTNNSRILCLVRHCATLASACLNFPSYACSPSQSNVCLAKSVGRGSCHVGRELAYEHAMGTKIAYKQERRMYRSSQVSRRERQAAVSQLARAGLPHQPPPARGLEGEACCCCCCCCLAGDLAGLLPASPLALSVRPGEPATFLVPPPCISATRIRAATFSRVASSSCSFSVATSCGRVARMGGHA